MNHTSRQFFASQFQSLSGILGALDCDLVLLSEDIPPWASRRRIRRSLGVLQSRVTNLNHWKPGNWHPFTDELGRLSDANRHLGCCDCFACRTHPHPARLQFANPLSEDRHHLHRAMCLAQGGWQTNGLAFIGRHGGQVWNQHFARSHGRLVHRFSQLPVQARIPHRIGPRADAAGPCQPRAAS